MNREDRSPVTPALLAAVREAYHLPWLGIHGVGHWGRVLENGRRLAKATGATAEVVELFAVLHDARRHNENHDPDHGRRGADLARQLRGVHFELSDEDFERLVEACTYHADGLTDGDVTVRTCWDADRLDLGRVGIPPDPRYRHDEGPDTWSPFDVVGHLIDGEEMDWMVRARIILAQDAERRFEPFDRFRHLRVNSGKTLDDLLERFADLRARNLEELKGLRLDRDQLRLTGEHPDFGSVTLEELLATWVAHDLGHLAQIARVMAKQYREAVGPWEAYLPVLHR